ADGSINTTLSNVASTWSAGDEDPAITALRRRWSYQATADITGKDGNTKSTGVGLGFVATLASAQDALKFYGSYNYATTEDTAGIETKSADETKAGVDYASFFSERA